jgi:AcrR family transcriptional regulator
MSATAPRPLRADARRNRERIVAAAGEVFAKYGSLAQIDEIAREAGVGVGTVYRHFPAKDALVGELVRLKFEEIAARVRVWVAREELDPWEAFAGLMAENVERSRADATQQRLMWEAPQAAFEHAAPALEALHEAVAPLLDRAKAAGVLRADFTADDIGTFMCACGGAVSAAQRGGRHDVDRLLELWLAGVRA